MIIKQMRKVFLNRSKRIHVPTLLCKKNSYKKLSPKRAYTPVVVFVLSAKILTMRQYCGYLPSN